MKPIDFTTITISKETHQRLVALPWLTSTKSSAVMNADDTVSFSISLDTHAQLLEVHQDIELAIQMLLGLKTN